MTILKVSKETSNSSGGVQRVSGLIYEEARGVLKVFLENCHSRLNGRPWRFHGCRLCPEEARTYSLWFRKIRSFQRAVTDIDWKSRGKSFIKPADSLNFAAAFKTAYKNNESNYIWLSKALYRLKNVATIPLNCPQFVYLTSCVPRREYLAEKLQYFLSFKHSNITQATTSNTFIAS